MVKIFYTFLALSIIYLVLELILGTIMLRKIKDSKTKYSSRKMLSVILWILFILVIFAIWIKDPQSLIVAYGII
ncbi:MAG: hypothetical protein KJ597_00865, partial [Nanoarchaeota archaeon]|nr:hypothetical protein [Nanoarchaeota archaeon]